jgi:putative ABC transport system substrate-binding protein
MVTAAASVASACGGKGRAGDDIRIGLLSSTNISSFGDGFNVALPFFQALAKAELPPARRVVSDVRLLSNQFAELDRTLAEMLAAKPDVIATHFPGTLEPVSKATEAIPIVALAAYDPSRQDLLQKLHTTRPNVTGISDPEAGVYGEKVDLLKEAFPQIGRLAVFIGTEQGLGLEQIPAWSAIQGAAARLGLSAEPIALASSGTDERAAAVARVRAMNPDALLSVNSGGVIGGFIGNLYQLTFQMRIPTAYDVTGGILNYFPDLDEAYAKAAEAVVRILHGERPSDIPLYTPKMRLTVRANDAQQIGLTVAPSVLAKADRVIQ